MAHETQHEPQRLVHVSMNDHDFICWLRGFAAGVDTPLVTAGQWQTIRDNLARVGPFVVQPSPILNNPLAYPPGARDVRLGSIVAQAAS